MIGELNITPLLEKLGKLCAFTGEEMQAIMRQEATLFISNPGKTPGVIQITPPYSRRDSSAAYALRAGKESINRDLAAVFSPRTIKGQRVIPHLFGDRNPDVRRKPPYTVATTERWPDVAAIAKERWKRKHETGRKVMSRGQRDPGSIKSGAYYVSATKLEIVRRESYSMIGLACACWYRAAIAANLTPRGVPSWVTRHTSAMGAGNIEVTDHSIRIVLNSSLPYNSALGMHEKATRVFGYRKNALDRRLPHVIRHAAQKAQLKAA